MCTIACFTELFCLLAALLKSEGSDSHSQNMATGSEEELRTAAARSIAHKQRQQPVNGKLRSMSFSDSAHSSQQRQSPPANKLRTGLSLNSTISRQTVAQYAEALDSPSHTMNGAFRGQDSAYRPADMFHVTQDALASSQPLSFPQHDSGVPLQAAPVLQQAQQPSSGRMEPVAEVNEDGSVHSSHGAELSGPAHQAGAELGGPALQAPPPLVNAPATEQSSLQDGDRTNVINTPWAYGGGERPEWAREQSKSVPFVSADESLKRHWRTIALQVRHSCRN